MKNLKKPSYREVISSPFSSFYMGIIEERGEWAGSFEEPNLINTLYDMHREIEQLKQMDSRESMKQTLLKEARSAFKKEIVLCRREALFLWKKGENMWFDMTNGIEIDLEKTCLVNVEPLSSYYKEEEISIQVFRDKYVKGEMVCMIPSFMEPFLSYAKQNHIKPENSRGITLENNVNISRPTKRIFPPFEKIYMARIIPIEKNLVPLWKENPSLSERQFFEKAKTEIESIWSESSFDVEEKKARIEEIYCDLFKNKGLWGELFTVILKEDEYYQNLTNGEIFTEEEMYIEDMVPISWYYKEEEVFFYQNQHSYGWSCNTEYPFYSYIVDAVNGKLPTPKNALTKKKKICE